MARDVLEIYELVGLEIWWWGWSVPARYTRSERLTCDDLENELVGEMVHGGHCVGGIKRINSRRAEREDI